MNTSPNKRKRRRKTESFENSEMAQSSSVNHENADCTGNKWKRRLHSLRRSLSKKKVTNLNGFRADEEQDEVSFESKNKEPVIADITFDNRCKENIVLNGWQQNCNEKESPLLNDYSSSNSPNLDFPISSDDKTKKRKGFHRRAKGDTMRGNKYDHSTSKQDLQSGKNKSLNGLEEKDSGVKRSKGRVSGRKNKRLSLFSSWFKLPSRASSEKNLKRRGRRLSVSTGNFNEQSNFKLLTDVKLLRDPGYVSSSGDSLDLDEERYQSLRRSRASLIDIKWHKHAKSEGNLANPVSRNRTCSLSPLSSAISKRKQIPRSCENSPNLQRDDISTPRTPRTVQNRDIIATPNEKCASNANKTWEGWRQVSKEVSQCDNSLGSFENITEDDDVYLTAEEGSSRSSPNLYLDTNDKPMHDCNKETRPKPQKLENQKKLEDVPGTSTNEKNISSPSLTISDINGNRQELAHASELSGGVTTPNSNSLHNNEILHVQPAKHFDKKTFENAKNNIPAKTMTYVCKSCQLQANGRKTIKPKDFRKLSLGQLTDFNERPVVAIRCMQCKSSRISKQSDTCHDVLITRPPKKPAPKPPALMKNKSKSLTALSGKFPVLSEQLDLNETSSLYKLNDSCSDNLCELLSQSKDASSPTSEGVYVGVMGDQGVILRKRRMYPKQKRVVSMPSDLLENVMEVEGTEGQSSTKDRTSRIRDGKTQPLQSSGSEVYLSCNSNAPSSYNSNAGVLNSSVEKELCSRSVSISSIDVQDVSMKKKIHSQSVPCLAFNKDCLNGLKSTQTNNGVLEEKIFSSQAFSVANDCISQQSSTAQSMMSLNFQQSQEGSDETSDKVRLVSACIIALYCHNYIYIYIYILDETRLVTS